MKNKKGVVSVIVVLLALIIGAVIGGIIYSNLDKNDNNYYSGNDYYDDNYDNQYDSGNDYYDDNSYDNDYYNDYQDTGYDNSYNDYPDYYSDSPDPNQDYQGEYQGQGQIDPNVNTKCGYLDLPCCEGTIERDPWGTMYVANRCFDDLECRAGYCVEGPEFEAYDRSNIYG